MSKLQSNPYKLIKVSNVNLHIGNGAKDALKNEKKKYNFKFFHLIGKKYKNCSSGFNNIDEFLNFTKPLNERYYTYEYIFENQKCLPYFDYEYEINEEPTKEYLDKKLKNIIILIQVTFEKIFKIKLDEKLIKITSSHGFKKENNFKISYHIIIHNYYFEFNKECSYFGEKLKEKDDNFDCSVYSKDRQMRCIGSYKNFGDNRILLSVANLDNCIFEDYLITNVKENYIKLNCPVKIIKKVVKEKYKNIKNNQEIINNNGERKIVNDDIGFKLEEIIKNKYHEDTYFERKVIKENDIIFYSFNYNDRIQKCFTGNIHEQLGFFCWIDAKGNIYLKCFSNKCKECKKIIGNINKINIFENCIEINNKYLNENIDVNKTIKKFKKSLLIKSSMGSGKTEILCDYIKEFKPKRILWLSVRQTYSMNICERLNDYDFTNYLDDENFYLKNRIIVQLESLHLLEKLGSIKPYDLIVLDEIESLLYHFDSSTITSRSENTFKLLLLLCINKNTKVIGMDADLNLRSLEFIKDVSKDYKIIVNNYVKEDIILNMVNNKDYWINEIKTSIKNNKKCCIIGLSTKLLYQVEELLIDDKISYIMHTRDTDDKFKKELKNVNELWKKYQVVMYSPSIVCGVDFTELYFDEIYSCIVSNCASPRSFKQMLGRIRNLKNNTILTYYQTINISMNVSLYNYNEMIDYFKYCDDNFKLEKSYSLNNKNQIEITNNFTPYNKIMMYNKIENLNKSNVCFMTQLNLLFINSNYKIVFINKIIEKSKKIKLNDDVYKEKILNAEDIYDEYEYDIINANIMNNMASEKDKFKMQKYEFKKFWKLENIKKQDLDKYFRCEIIYNRLMVLLNKKKNTLNEDKYIDYDINKKIEVIKNIINTLGFDLNNLTIKIPRDDYYEKIKVLLSNENSFKKDYDKIRILFDKNRHNLNENINNQTLSKILNGILDNLGLKIINKKTCKRINNENIYSTTYLLSIEKKYLNIKK